MPRIPVVPVIYQNPPRTKNVSLLAKTSKYKLFASLMIILTITSVLAVNNAAASTNQTPNNPSTINAPASIIFANFNFTPANPAVNDTVYFDARSSYSVNGITTFIWSWGDGTFPPNPILFGYYAQTTHQFQLNGTFTVTLNITDSSGLTASISKTITVHMPSTNTPPAPLFKFTPAKPLANQTVTFDASASRDPDGDPITKYNWTGVLLEQGGTVPGSNFTASGVVFQHTFTKTGVYYISLTVTDNQHLSASQNTFVPVTRIPYVPGVKPGIYAKYYFSSNQTTIGPILAAEVNITQVSGTRVLSEFSALFANGTAIPIVRGIIDIYNGPVNAFLFTTIAANLTTADPIYANYGFIWRLNSTKTEVVAGTPREVSTFLIGGSNGPTEYDFDRLTGLPVRVDIIGLSQNTTLILGDTNAWTPTVNATPLPLFYWTPDNPNPGQTVTFNASHSYDPDHETPLTYLWSLGDGTTSSTVSPTRTYPVPGNYTVTLTVTDPQGASATANKEIAIGKPSLATIYITDDSACSLNDPACRFTPTMLTVTNGTKVTWVNNGTIGGHAPTSCSTANNPPTATGACAIMDDPSLPSFASPVIPAGGSFSYTFTKPGTYYYFCNIHPWMHGTVIVTSQADFSISANPSSLSIPQGGSKNSMITLTSLNRFKGTIALTTVAPAGITTNLASGVLSLTPYGTNSTSLNIIVSPTTATGLYTITLYGTNSTLTNRLDLLITVTPPPSFDFSLSPPSPGSLTVAQGTTSLPSSITAALISGKTTSLAFSAQGLPNGVTAAFTNNSCSPNCTVTVSFSATASATPGTYTIKIQAAGSGQTHAVTLQLNVQQNNAIGGSVIATINVGSNPQGVGYNSLQGYIYVLNFGSNTVSVISGTSVIATTVVSSHPYGVEVAYDSNNNYLYVPNSGSNNVGIISGTTYVTEVTVGSGPISSWYDSGNGLVYVTNRAGNSVTVINGTTVKATIPVGTGPDGVGYDPLNGYIYVANGASPSSVSVINGTKVIATISIGTESLNGLAVDTNTGYVYVAHGSATGTVSVISGTTLIGSVPVGGNPWGLAYDSAQGYIYVANEQTSNVTVIKGTSVVGTIKVGTGPIGVAYDSQNGYIYVSNAGSGTVSVISPTATSTFDFSLNLDKTVMATVSGTQTSESIHLSSSGGFGTVSLSLNYPSTYLSCSFSPSIVTLNATYPTSTSTLSCTPSAPGAYTVNITGATSGGATHSTTVTVLASRISYLPGVKVGDFFSLIVTQASWSSTVPSLTEPSLIALFKATNHIDFTVTAVSGTTVTVHQVWNYNNGTAPTFGNATLDIATGTIITTGVFPEGNPTNLLLATGLQAPDHLVEDPSSSTLNTTVTRVLLGSSRTIDFQNITATFSNGSISSGLAWDQTSGILVNVASHAISVIPGGTETTDFAVALSQTNIWTATVVKTSTTTTVTCGPSSINVGRFTSCTVTVIGSSPSGDVTFTTSSSTGTFTPSTATCTLTAAGSCSATYADASSSSFTATITASFPGDAQNSQSQGSTSVSVSKPAGIIAVGVTSTTINNGGTTVSQTATGISVTISGSTAANGTPIGVTTQTLSAPLAGVSTPSLTSPSYYDVQVTGVYSGTAQVCISLNSASSSTTMQYWDGTAWTTASAITVNGTTVCGQIPVFALTGTNVAVGNSIQSAPSQPNSSNLLLYIIVGVVVAVVVVIAVVAVLRRRGNTANQ